MRAITKWGSVRFFAPTKKYCFCKYSSIQNRLLATILTITKRRSFTLTTPTPMINFPFLHFTGDRKKWHFNRSIHFFSSLLLDFSHFLLVIPERLDCAEAKRNPNTSFCPVQSKFLP